MFLGGLYIKFAIVLVDRMTTVDSIGTLLPLTHGGELVLRRTHGPRTYIQLALPSVSSSLMIRSFSVNVHANSLPFMSKHGSLVT